MILRNGHRCLLSRLGRRLVIANATRRSAGGVVIMKNVTSQLQALEQELDHHLTELDRLRGKMEKEEQHVSALLRAQHALQEQLACY